MIDSCAPIPGTASLARDLLATTDCMIASRMESAYAALLAPGGVFSSVVTTVLVIYVALLGYRLMLGLSALTLGEIIPHVVRIGIVVALATNWPSYQQIVVNLLFHGPEQIANAIVRQTSGVQRLGQTELLPTLQNLFDEMTGYAADAWGQGSTTVTATTAPATPGVPPAAAVDSLRNPVDPLTQAGTPPPTGAATALRFQPGAPQFVAAALWLAALLMMASSIGVLLVARIILALLLIMGPVFILAGLFNASRGLAEGWLRTTLRFALVPLFTLPMTAAMVAILIPLVNRLTDSPEVNFRDGPALPILLVVVVFAAVLFQAIRLAGGIAAGVRLPRGNGPVMPAGTSANAAAAANGFSMVTTNAGTAVPRQGIAGAAGRGSGDAMVTMQNPRLITTLSAPPAPAMATGSRLGQQYRRLAIGPGTAVARRTER